MMGVLNHLSTLLLLSLLPPALSHVVERFDPECKEFFLEGITPNLTGILVNGKVQDQNRYKPICQLFKYKKKTEVNNTYMFATLYDTNSRIPVFSAYTFTGVGSREKRPDTWMIEPQLDGGVEQVMSLEKQGVIYTHQAVNQDYDEYGKDKKVNRGHMFPKSFAHQPVNQNSTFTLTNAVPQVKTFNEGSWGKMECEVRTILLKQCLDNTGKPKAYVVTGAVPSDNNKLNNRVNIPDLMWTAYCCYNSEKKEWMAKAHWGKNQEEDQNKVLGHKTLPSKTLAELYDMLKGNYSVDVQLFPDQCPKGDILRALLLKDGDVHDHCVYDNDCVCSSVGVKGYYLPVVFVSVLVMMM